MSTSFNPISSTTGAASATTTPQSAASTASDALANEQVFLKLLVSQLQNQNPLSPTDSNQFVAQLTSYGQMEQLIGIHKDTTDLRQSITDTASTTTNSIPENN